jgi:hypothetical protein
VSPNACLFGSALLCPALPCSALQKGAIGSTNLMMAGGCEPYCVWNSDITTDDVEFAIELDDFPAWVEDVKKIFNADLRENGAAPDR